MNSISTVQGHWCLFVDQHFVEKMKISPTLDRSDLPSTRRNIFTQVFYQKKSSVILYLSRIYVDERQI